MNPIIFVVLAAVLIGIAFYLVALPLLQQARRNTNTSEAASSSEQERLAELMARRDAVFQALRELSFDHKLGKITHEDFVAFEANLKQNAAESLRALDQWEAEADDDLDDVMERAISARKAVLGGANIPNAADGRVCPKCGKAAVTGDKFCGSCGTPLPATASPLTAAAPNQPACPNCGRPHQPGDKFCPRCGQALEVQAAPLAS